MYERTLLGYLSLQFPGLAPELFQCFLLEVVVVTVFLRKPALNLLIFYLLNPSFCNLWSVKELY